MRSRFLIFSCFVLFALLLLAWPGNSVLSQSGGDEPTAVGLVSFTATTHPNGVQLTWETATELNTLAFILHRRTGNTGDFVYLEDIGVIDALGSPALGYIYQEIDETAVLGQTYTYRLIEIESNNQQAILDEVTITVGATPTPTPSHTPTATATPTIRAGAGTTATPTVSPTPSATTTPTSSATTATPATDPGPPAANPTRLVTVTPISVGSGNSSPDAPPGASQATAVPATGNLPGATTPIPTTTATAPATALPDAAGRGEAVLAQGLETRPPTDDGQPGTMPGQLIPADNPPDSDTLSETSDTTAPTALAVIGDDEAYAAPGQSPAITAQTSQTNGRSTLFLWIGFIVSLLIFITGVIGSIILYTRRVK